MLRSLPRPAMVFSFRDSMPPRSLGPRLPEYGPQAGSGAAPASAAGALQVTCWGARGSIPTPGPATARFGGNTPCIEVRSGERRLIFDAGTGIRVLGQRLVAEPGQTRADLFLTHFHWDHIQGLPFFAPLYDASSHIHVHGARQGDIDIRTLVAGQMAAHYFPIPYEALAATLEFSEHDGAPWQRDGIDVAGYRVRHPANTYGYRIRSGGASVAYVPDNELVGGNYPAGPDWYPGLVRFLEGVDLLYHDAMFDDSEYTHRAGWGHSTCRQSIRLARDAGVRRLCIFHHSPERSDADLERIVDGLRNELARDGSTLELGIATEGEELVVQRRAP